MDLWRSLVLFKKIPKHGKYIELTLSPREALNLYVRGEYVSSGPLADSACGATSSQLHKTNGANTFVDILVPTCCTTLVCPCVLTCTIAAH